MHPAFSVIFFTVSSGTGYGLLFLFGLLATTGTLPDDPVFAFVGMATGLGLVGAGLLASMLHLGHPKRAWRAFSQWKTSWLSREGIAAVISFCPGLALMYLWVLDGTSQPLLQLFGMDGISQPLFQLLGGATALMAVVTVYCTAMIYRSLPPVHQWANGWTLPGYLCMGLAGGGVILVAFYALFDIAFSSIPLYAVAALAVAWGAKIGYWHFVDNSQSASTAETATGLGGIGKVRQLEAPHTEDNYLLKEMGFKIAQKHAKKLRRYAHTFGFVLPILFVLAAYQSSNTSALFLSVLALISFGLGAVVERWLFFAQARHTVTLYYQK